jgi:hypothetical protein
MSSDNEGHTVVNQESGLPQMSVMLANLRLTAHEAIFLMWCFDCLIEHDEINDEHEAYLMNNIYDRLEKIVERLSAPV